MIGCDCTYSILRFRGVPYHHLLGSVRFVAADRPHTINPYLVIPAPYHVIPGAIVSFPVLSCHSRAYPVIPVAITSFLLPSHHSWAYRVIPAPITSFALPSRHSSAPITSFAVPSRHSRAYPVIPPRPSRRSRCHRVIPAPITSFPRRRESCGLFPKRIHWSTCATMNQTERPLLSSLLHCGEAGGHDAVYVDMMLSIEVEVVA